MGPYVIRSVNAHLKSWEDEVDDSINDPLMDADPTGLPTPNCTCSLRPVGCGIAPCRVTEALTQKVCYPLNCQPQGAGLCQTDDACCGWVSSGDCGAGCPPGQRLKQWQCGDEPPGLPTCQPDTDCVFRCTGTIPVNSTPCTGDDTGLLFGDLPWVPVPQGGCTDALKCESECNPGNIFDQTQQICRPLMCGDIICEGAEDCLNCSSDCGVCLSGCGADPAEDFDPFPGCSLVGGNLAFQYCQGDCSDDDAKETVCCADAHGFIFSVKTAKDNQTQPTCDPGWNTLVQFCEGTCRAVDARDTICYQGTGVLNCRAITDTIRSYSNWPSCNANEYIFYQSLSGDGGPDDARVVVCCQR